MSENDIHTILSDADLQSLGSFADTPNPAFPLWPDGKIPLAVCNPKPEGIAPMRDDIIRMENVSVPQIIVACPPKAAKPTPAVVVCPGGGYAILAWNHEGIDIAQWLKGKGIATVVLKYRVPECRDAALADAQRALRWIRANAAAFNVDPAKVGIMGFSAGANLAVRAATAFRHPIYAAVDEIDAQSCRPDFQMAIYPWDLLERNDPSDPWKGHHGLSIRQNDYPVGKDTPPAFIMQSEDDPCAVETSLGYFKALKDAGVSARLHVFERGGHGGHGYGIRTLGCPTDAWPALAESWLEQFK